MNRRFLDDESRWVGRMAQAQAGDGAVHARLLTELGSAIETYIRVGFGALDALEDRVQECLIAVHAARHTQDPRRPYRPWPFTVVRKEPRHILAVHLAPMLVLGVIRASALASELQADTAIYRIGFAASPVPVSAALPLMLGGLGVVVSRVRRCA